MRSTKTGAGERNLAKSHFIYEADLSLKFLEESALDPLMHNVPKCQTHFKNLEGDESCNAEYVSLINQINTP